jgi:hypothetical protein
MWSNCISGEKEKKKEGEEIDNCGVGVEFSSRMLVCSRCWILSQALLKNGGKGKEKIKK